MSDDYGTKPMQWDAYTEEHCQRYADRAFLYIDDARDFVNYAADLCEMGELLDDDGWPMVREMFRKEYGR